MPQTIVHLIAAARPNFMKVAPLYHALKGDSDFDVRVVHTGQHYDHNMSDAFFADLGLPTSDYHLDVGSGTHAEQTSTVMVRYEKICLESRPDWTVVVGDVNSTAAAAMVCAKLHIPVVHLEAGLRSGDRRMPEEINRLVTDAICDLLWTPSPDADENLLREGVPPDRIERVGNIMMDSYELLRDKIEQAGTRAEMGLADQAYGLVTLHRPANVDNPETLAQLVEQLAATSEKIHLVFPIHPRTLKSLKDNDLYRKLALATNIRIVEPVGYIQFMNLLTKARLAITDSGGLQEETTYLGIPCLTLRPNTERPVTITQGTNRLAEPGRLLAEVENILAQGIPERKCPELWDGQTAQRCLASLKARIHGSSGSQVQSGLGVSVS